MKMNLLYFYNMRPFRLMVALLLLMASPSLRGAEPPVDQHNHQVHGLSGPTFSDPAVLAVVPEGWERKPVKHEPAQAKADLVVALGQQSHPIFKEIIQKYARKHGLIIHLTEGTCGITAGKLLRKTVDLGAFCCPPGQSDRLPGLEFHTLGVSPIAVIVHPDNPLTDVSLRQARQLFQGHITRWSGAGTPATSAIRHQLVQPVARLHCKTRPGHWRLLLANEDHFSPRLFEVGVIPDMISQIAHNPRAVGYEVPFMVKYHAFRGHVRMLKIDGHHPTDLDSVATQKYPFYRTYHLTSWKDGTPASREAKKLIAFMRDYIERHGKKVGFVSPSRLKRAGWRFRGEELIGEPGGKQARKPAPG